LIENNLFNKQIPESSNKGVGQDYVSKFFVTFSQHIEYQLIQQENN